MKRIHAENWSTRERLVLASSVLRSGDQNWMSVSRSMRAMAEGERSAEWYSQKQCAVQYEHLLNTLGGTAMPKRKKRSLDASTLAAADTPQEIIVRKLTQERIEELRSQMVELRAAYLREKHEQEELLSGRLDSRLDEIEQADAERELESNRTKEQASPVKLEPQTAQPESKPTSPLLTSLLQMPSPAMMHRSPTISSLLISSPPVPVPNPAVTPPRPIAATTLSQLLESPTIAIPTIQKTRSPSRSPATSVPANNPPDNVEEELSEKEITEFLTELIPAGVGEQVLTLADNVKDDLIDVKIEDIPLVETDPSAVVTDVDPTEVIVSAENIQTEEVDVKDTSIISNQGGDSSAIDDTPDSDLIAETLSELADLDSRTVEMIVVGPNAQLAGGIKEELVEITSTDIDLATGAAAAAAASMKEIIEGAEVVVEGEAVTGGVIEEAVVDSTVIVDNIVDFGNSIAEETVVEEEVIEKMPDGKKEEEGEVEVKVEEVVEEHQQVVEDEVVVEEEQVENVVEEGEGEKEMEEQVEERVEEVEEAKIGEEAADEEEQAVSVEESVVETIAEVGLQSTDERVEKEVETKEETDEEEATKQEESVEVKETEEICKDGEEEKEDEMTTDAEETVEEVKEKEDVVDKEDEVVEEKGEEEEEDEEEVEEARKEEGEETTDVTQADVGSAIAVAVNEMMSSSSTPSTPTSAVLPNILSVASDTVSTSRPETPSTEEDNEPVANLAKKISRRHGGLSGSNSLPNSPLSINALEERAALNAWKKSIMLVYNRLATHKYASLFLKPITNEQAHGYHSVIHRPMDLSTIKKNIEMGNLRTTVEFQRDMMLMFQNAIMYNNQSTLVYQMATQMQAECIQHIQLMVEAMGEGVPLRGDADDMDSSKMTRGRGKTTDSTQPAADLTRKRKRTSLPETTTGGKKKKILVDEEAKKN